MAAKKPPAAPSPHARATVARVPMPSVPRPAAPVPAVVAEAPATAPRTPRRTALRALVPSAVRPEGETDPFVAAYKAKWLSQLDFKSDISLRSLLVLCFIVLALEREAEAEAIANAVIRHTDMKRLGPDARATVASVLRLAAWLKAKRGVDVTPLLVRANELVRDALQRDRTWLSDEAEQELRDAVARHKVDYLVDPMAGVLRWLNDSGARTKAEGLLGLALDAIRTLMRAR